MQYYPEFFEWWVISISSSIVFMTVVAVFLYVNSRERRRNASQVTGRKRLRSNFIFVWVLLGLLVLYVVSINMGSYNLFALGNVVVELVLMAYLVKNRAG